jgi:L-ascorbate metabolism protein UlaG (beta-lactamase superfamily)
VNPDTLTNVDHILITHDHSDHLGDALAIANRTGASVIAIYDLICTLGEQGLAQEKGLGMNIGGSLELDGMKIRMTPALHSSGSGAPAGFVVTLADGFTFYHAGDTALFSDMTLIARRHCLDLAMLPMDGRFNMDAEDAAEACRLLACKKVMAMHWGTFPVLAQDTLSFEQALKEKAPDTRLIPMTPGVPLFLEKT